MRCCSFLFVVVSALASDDAARSISNLRLDPNECYKLTDIDLQRGPVSIHLDAGWIIFAETVSGIRPGAVYISSSAENRIGLAPTAASERLALDRAVHKTSLNEPFGRSLMLFTDGTDATIGAALARQHAPKDVAKGAAVAQEWTSIFAHIADSFHTRIVRDLMNGDRGRGVFYIGVSSPALGISTSFMIPRQRTKRLPGRYMRACSISWPRVANRSRRFRKFRSAVTR